MEKIPEAWEPGSRLAVNRRRFLGFRRRFSESRRRFSESHRRFLEFHRRFLRISQFSQVTSGFFSGWLAAGIFPVPGWFSGSRSSIGRLTQIVKIQKRRLAKLSRKFQLQFQFEYLSQIRTLSPGSVSGSVKRICHTAYDFIIFRGSGCCRALEETKIMKIRPQILGTIVEKTIITNRISSSVMNCTG